MAAGQETSVSQASVSSGSTSPGDAKTVDFSSNMMQLMTEEDFGAFLVSDQHLQPFRASCLILMRSICRRV